MSKDYIDLHALKRSVSKSKIVWQSQEDRALAQQMGAEEWQDKKGDNIRKSIIGRRDTLLARSFHEKERRILEEHRQRLAEIAKADEEFAAQLMNEGKTSQMEERKRREEEEMRHFEELMREEKARQDKERAQLEEQSKRDEDIAAALGNTVIDDEEKLRRLVAEDERLAQLLNGDLTADEELARKLQEEEEAERMRAGAGEDEEVFKGKGKGKGKAKEKPASIEDRVFRLQAEHGMGDEAGAAMDLPDEEREFLRQQREIMERLEQERKDAQIARRLSEREEERKAAELKKESSSRSSSKGGEDEELPEVEFGFDVPGRIVNRSQVEQEDEDIAN